jgi:hypothetical protein
MGVGTVVAGVLIAFIIIVVVIGALIFVIGSEVFKDIEETEQTQPLT